MVECKTCSRRYPSLFPETNEMQASGCAAIVADNSIIAFYGSSFDTDQWDFVSRPAHVIDGIICDMCIEDLKRKKEIVFVKELEIGF